MQRSVTVFAWGNLLLGIVALVGPLMTGSREVLLHVETGWLLGLVAFNWGHSLLHLVLGAHGVVAARTHEGAVAFAWLAAVVLGLVGVLGVLGEVGVLVRRGPEGPLRILGMAVDWPGHVLHLLLAALAAALALAAARQRAGHAPARAERSGG